MVKKIGMSRATRSLWNWMDEHEGRKSGSSLIKWKKEAERQGYIVKLTGR